MKKFIYLLSFALCALTQTPKTMAHGRDINYMMPNGKTRFLPEGFGEKLGGKRVEEFTPPESSEARLAEQDLTKTAQTTTLNPQANKLTTDNVAATTGFDVAQLSNMAVTMIGRYEQGDERLTEQERTEIEKIIDASFQTAEIPGELENFTLDLNQESAGRLKELTGKMREALDLDKKFTKVEKETLIGYLDELDSMTVVIESDGDQGDSQSDQQADGDTEQDDSFEDLSKRLLG